MVFQGLLAEVEGIGTDFQRKANVQVCGSFIGTKPTSHTRSKRFGKESLTEDYDRKLQLEKSELVSCQRWVPQMLYLH